jgi:hypothetical protein
LLDVKLDGCEPVGRTVAPRRGGLSDFKLFLSTPNRAPSLQLQYEVEVQVQETSIANQFERCVIPQSQTHKPFIHPNPKATVR